MEARLEARDHELENAVDHQAAAPAESAPASRASNPPDTATLDQDQPDPDEFAEAFGINES